MSCPVMCAGYGVSGAEMSPSLGPAELLQVFQSASTSSSSCLRPVKGRNSHQLLNNSGEQLECQVPSNSALSFTDQGTGERNNLLGGRYHALFSNNK